LDADFPSLRVVHVGLCLWRSLQRPTRALCTGRLRVTGPPTFRPHHGMRTGRRAPLLRFRLRLPFGVRWSRRTAWSYLLRAIPLRRCSDVGTHARKSARPCGFQRLASPVLCVCVGDAARAGHSRPISFGSRTGPAPGCYRDLAGTVKVPATPVGFTYVPFAVLLPSAGDDASSAFVAPTCRFATCRREFHRREVHLIGRTKGLWPRLLGFGPADEPCRVICRPRYSFYA